MTNSPPKFLSELDACNSHASNNPEGALSAAQLRSKVLREIGERRLTQFIVEDQEQELHPRPSPLDGLLRPSIPLLKETHRLLRAVAIKRAKKIPGTQPSIGAIVEELVQRHRVELEQEAGSIFKRELEKKR